jgi:hypothetical protein
MSRKLQHRIYSQYRDLDLTAGLPLQRDGETGRCAEGLHASGKRGSSSLPEQGQQDHEVNCICNPVDQDEARMLGFVPQQVHRQRAAKASTQDTDGEQALLRDPPPPGSGCHLVIGIHAETEDVQQDENCCDESLHVCSPFFDARSRLYYTSDLFCCGPIILQPRCLDDCPSALRRSSRSTPEEKRRGRPGRNADRRSPAICETPGQSSRWGQS